MDRFWSTHQLRGDALLGLAGQCRRTAGRRDLPRETRQRAQQQLQDYLDTAERSLKRAMSLAAGEVEPARIIQRNIDYLERMRRDSSAPQ